jgi:hypothetical protein
MFLMFYIISNDMNNARHLWKRIPKILKDATKHPKDSKLLHEVWAVGKQMAQ